jgi:hypothetical protein
VSIELDNAEDRKPLYCALRIGGARKKQQFPGTSKARHIHQACVWWCAPKYKTKNFANAGVTVFLGGAPQRHTVLEWAARINATALAADTC